MPVRVLVVEDEARLAASLKRGLTSDGFAVDTAADGEEGPCGWVKDKYGFSWQVIPAGMNALFADPEKSKANRALAAMLKMKKIDMAELKKAAEGK